MRKWLILGHRWLGVVLGLFFVLWFASGIVMVFTGGMPELSARERLDHLAPIDFARVTLTPREAVLASRVTRGGRLSLLMIQGRPAYRIGGSSLVTIFADTGERRNDGMEDDEAVAVAASFLRVLPATLRHVEVLDDPDQWTIEMRRDMPLHRIDAADAAATELYVSEPSGEVVLATTSRSRALAWAGAIPHWMYLKAIRVRGAWWRQLVLWASGLGTISAAIGVLLAWTQFRVQYAGLLRWHYWTGAVFGIFAVTWVFSGWLSMEPGEWTSGESAGARVGQAISGVLDLSRYPAFAPAAWAEFSGESGVGAVKEIEFRSVLDEPVYIVRGDRTVIASVAPLQARREPFAVDGILARVARGAEGVPVRSAEVLADYDSYYYDRDRAAALPVLRVRFADAAATWVYVDLQFGEFRAAFTRRERVNRWLYHGLHDLDFSFWYYNRPLWNAVLVTLCAGGTTLSVLGVALAWRRVRRRSLRLRLRDRFLA